MEALFTADDLIHAYTRAQALEDGVLVDVTAAADAVGVRVHTAMTAGLFADVGGEDKTRLLRALGDVRAALLAAPADEDRVYFTLRGVGGDVDAWAHIGPGDDGEPVLTLMRQGED
jgi:hypothetical protein